MNPNNLGNSAKNYIIMALVGAVLVIWVALLCAPYSDGGLPEILSSLPQITEKPFDIHFTEYSARTVAIFLLIYGITLGVYFSTQRHYRRGEEHGSAKMGDAGSFTRKYANKVFNENILLTQNARIGLDGRKHKRNLNVLVVGGSGAGKTRFYCKPNIMQANTSFFILDTKAEMLYATGNLLKEKGYDIKILDFINMDMSYGYNPFSYLRDEKDVLKLVDNLIKNTTPKGASQGDPFWERSETALLEALILYLMNEAPEEEQNFPMVMELLNAAEVREEDEQFASVLDELFERLEEKEPDSLAVKQYHIFKMAAGDIKSYQRINHVINY